MERNLLYREISNLNMEQESSLGSFLGALLAPISIPGLKKNAMQQMITQVALEEWERWRQGELTEDKREAFPLLVKYWKKGSSLSDSAAQQAAQNFKNHHWSAAFVSYVMRQVYSQFPGVTAHMEYYRWARENKEKKKESPFYAFKPTEVTIEVGDVLLNERPGGTHGDIVVSISDNIATVIGGNVSNSTSEKKGVTVDKKPRLLTSNNKLTEPGKFFAVIKLMPPGQGIAETPSSHKPNAPAGAVRPGRTDNVQPLDFWRITIGKSHATALVKSGILDPDKVADEIFYNWYPEQKGRKIVKGGPVAALWTQIRKDIVQTVFDARNNPPPTRKPPSTSTPDTGIIYLQATFAPLLAFTSERNPDELTNKLFFQLHPERKGRDIAPGEAAAIEEWKMLRKTIVVPGLRKISSTTLTASNTSNLVVSKRIIEDIIRSEVSSSEEYTRRYQHPMVPTDTKGAVIGDSGITIGIGYDLGQKKKEEVMSDWHGVIADNDIQLLLEVTSLTKERALSALPKVKSMVIPLEAAKEVYMKSLRKTAKEVRRMYPGVEKLYPDAQGALLSLVYNRGARLTEKPNTLSRKEMREIKDLIPKLDYDGISDRLLSMVRLWPGKRGKGLRLRREREALIVKNANREYQKDELLYL